MVTHMLTRDVPDGEKDAMSLVIACAVLVRLSKIAKRDWAISCRNDLRKQDVLRRSSEHVPATDAALGLHESGALEDEQDLFEIRLGQTCSRSDVTYRGWSAFAGVKSE
jgi:hypothetical protein